METDPIIDDWLSCDTWPESWEFLLRNEARLATAETGRALLHRFPVVGNLSPDLRELLMLQFRSTEGGATSAVIEHQLIRESQWRRIAGDAASMEETAVRLRSRVDQYPLARWVNEELALLEAEIDLLASNPGAQTDRCARFVSEALSIVADGRLRDLFSLLLESRPLPVEIEALLEAEPSFRAIVVGLVSRFGDPHDQLADVLEVLSNQHVRRQRQTSSLPIAWWTPERQRKIGRLRRFDHLLAYQAETAHQSADLFANHTHSETARRQLAASSDEEAFAAASANRIDEVLGRGVALVFLLHGRPGVESPKLVRFAQGFKPATRDLDHDEVARAQILMAAARIGTLPSGQPIDRSIAVQAASECTSQLLLGLSNDEAFQAANEVVFVCDEVMSLLPFHTATDADGTFLAEIKAVRYGATAATALRVDRTPADRAGVVTVASGARGLHLAQGEKWVAAARGLTPAHESPHLDGLLLAMQEVDRVHIIDHGSVGMTSAQARVGSTRHSEFTATDVAALRPRASRAELFLAACSVGAASIPTTRHQMTGMAAAGVGAGYSRVIAATWPVRDDVAFTFNMLYTHYALSVPDPVWAFALAQRDLMVIDGSEVVELALAFADAAAARGLEEATTSIRQAAILLRGALKDQVQPFSHPYDWGAYTLSS